MSLTSFEIPDGVFAAIIRVDVNRAKPNTTYFVERAAEYDGAPVSYDGVCQRADGNWAPSDGSTIPSYFLQFPLGGVGVPDPGPNGEVLVTDANGSGSTQFEYHTPALPRGRKFDMRARLVDNKTAPTSELWSACMTITTK